ncbi:hypothetical protein QBC34DRAFT_151667 [Podospora aff. communis PSN243]|uniref:C2H2-type domain-containing protein n=1 Tax=Podospora aff. communis PSN243 TaxID=3040156 RepID=A0AAV9GB88_9PEZI|nr:hypothetical protein QBC34DRAFT_151667 [Podospora aff. communis PSN243]
MAEVTRQFGDLDYERNDEAGPPARRNRGPSFICQFYARSPLETRFQKCRPREEGGRTLNVFTRHADLTQHHRRIHPMPPHCPRCWEVFDGTDQEQAHARADVRCDVVHVRPVLGVGAQQLREMATRPRNLPFEQRWYRDYATIFPDEPHFTGSPCPTLMNGDFIDIVNNCIDRLESETPDLCGWTLSVVRQMFESQRLGSRISRPLPLDLLQEYTSFPEAPSEPASGNTTGRRVSISYRGVDPTMLQLAAPGSGQGESVQGSGS